MDFKRLVSVFLALVLSAAAGAAEPQRNLSAQRAPAAAGDKRVALVIGNGAYRNSPLKNPVNDARDMAARLRALGFGVVERTDLTTRQIGATLREFRSRLAPGAVALVFYAGHGLQIKGENYLPAVDAEITGEEDVPLQSLAVRQLLDLLDEAKARLNLIFLDACRNNPYARSFRSAGDGLAKLNAPSGTLISFATRPGSVAADGSGRNGLYTSQLLAQMADTGQPIEFVLKRVVSGVKAASRGAQEPWMEGSIEGDFCFGGCAAAGTPVAAAPDSGAIELAYWESVKDSRSATEYRAYLEQFPNGRFAALARARADELARPAAALQAAPAPAPSPAAAPDLGFPTRPLRLVVPFSPGGSTDAIGRVVANRLTQLAGQAVIVENRPGAGGAIGSAAVAKAAPDGYTLLLGSALTQAMGPATRAQTPYDPQRDFTPLAALGETPMLLLVPSSSPHRDLAALVAAGRAAPGQLSYASSGVGSGAHLMAELFLGQAGFSAVHVPYKGGGPALADLLGGQVRFMFAEPASALGHLKSGNLRALAVTAPRRLAQAPEVPTTAELGYPGVSGGNWFGLFAPAGTPPGIAARLSDLARRALADPEVAGQLAAMGLSAPARADAAWLGELSRADGEKWRRVANGASIRSD